MASFAYESVIAALQPTAFCLLAIGGLLYSIGVVFHVWRTLPFQNAIWHGFVLVATACHYGTIWWSLQGCRSPELLVIHRERYNQRL